MLISAQSAMAAVTLIYFRAESQSGQVVLRWSTATEIDNAGFFVNRSLDEYSGFVRISPFIASSGDSLTGDDYSYIDFTVTNYVAYWYKLEVIDNSSNSSFFEPPVLAVPGVVLTATPTATGTDPVTSTPTATQFVSTATPTPANRTATPTTVGLYPAPATATSISMQNILAQTGTPSSDLGTGLTTDDPSLSTNAGATATLIPLPDVTMQFPDVPTAAVDIALKNGGVSASNVEQSSLSWFTPERSIFVGFILLIWFLLGGWYFITMRKLE